MNVFIFVFSIKKKNLFIIEKVSTVYIALINTVMKLNLIETI